MPTKVIDLRLWQRARQVQERRAGVQPAREPGGYRAAQLWCEATTQETPAELPRPDNCCG